MTNIQDTLTYADGSPASGRLVVAWKPFVVSNVSVAGGELEFWIIDGHVALSLYSNANALPVGSYYSAKFELENGAVYVEQWIVPNVPTATLGQVRVSFPPSPSVIISPLQLSSLNAQPGMFLMWDGSKWVPGYPSTFNINPNYFSMVVAASGNDVNINGSPVALGGVLTINIPDASVTARGVVTTGTQSFTGNKTFNAAVNVPGTATIGNLVVTGTVTLPPNSYVPVSRKILSGAGLSGGGDLTADRTLVVVNDTTTQRVRTSAAGTLVTQRQEINFISGANATVQVVDDAANNRVNVTVGSLAFADPTQAKGDMLARSTTALSRLVVGLDGQALLADSSTSLGVKWATVVAGVSSVFGRTGAVVAQAGDYTAAQVTGAVADSRQILAGTGLTGGGDLTADRTLAVVDDTSTQRLQFALAGALKATRHRVNFIAGSGINLNLVDDTALNNQANVTITAVSTGAPSPSIFSVNGAQIGIRSELNLIAGTNISLSGVDNSGAGRVDITITSIGAGPGTVTSVFTRTGAVVAQAGDYTAAQVTNAVDSTGSYPNPNFIPSYAWNKITGAPSFVLSTRQVIAGSGLGGGGPLSADVTLTANVTSVFGRTGAVVLTAADITAAGGVPATRQVLAGVGLTGGGDLSADRTFAVVNDTTTQRVRVAKAGAVIGTRPQINFIQGANVSLTVADDIAANNQVNVTVAATTSGLADPTITKGDLIVRGLAAPPTRLGVGGDGLVLTADSSEPTLGIRWAAAAAAASPAGSVQWNNAGAFGGSANLTWDNVNGRLGIGTATPQTVVHAYRAGGGTTAITVDNDSLSGYPVAQAVQFRFGASGVLGGIYHQTDAGSSPWWLRFKAWNNSAEQERMCINGSTGNVGIGTANPGGRLEVFGVGGTPGTGANILRLSRSGGTNILDCGSYTTSPFGMWMQAYDSSGSPIYPLCLQPTGGNVGIGTTTPTTLLSLGTALAPVKLAVYDGGVSNCYGIGIQSGYLTFIAGLNPTSGTPQMVLTSTGNVGIGTINPATILHLYRSQNATTALTIDNDSVGSSVGQGINFAYGTVGVIGSITHTSGTGGAFNMHFTVWNASAPTERLTIIGNNGNVGIGTNNPFQLLSVISASIPNTVATANQITIGENTNNGQYRLCLGYGNFGGAWTSVIQSTVAGPTGPLALNPAGGNVGIGTASPIAILNVKYGPGPDPSLAGVVWASYIYNANNAANYDGLLVANNWASPASTVMDVGNVNASNGVYTTYLKVMGHGPVGILKASPAYALDVTGDVNCTGVFRVNGTAIGGGLSARSVVTGSRAFNTAYQNNTGRWMFVAITASLSGNSYLQLASDASNPPGTLVSVVTNMNASTSGNFSVCGWVVPGEWYRAPYGGGSLSTWIEYT
jgi:hypothetical protein